MPLYRVGTDVRTKADASPVTAADEAADAQAEYHMPGADLDQMSEWFAAQLPKAGWGEPEDVDGALQFVHQTELGKRSAREGIKRHALVLLLAADDGVDIVLNVEEPD